MKYTVVAAIAEKLQIDDPEAFERELEDELRAAIVRQIDENIQRDIDGEQRAVPAAGVLRA